MRKSATFLFAAVGLLSLCSCQHSPSSSSGSSGASSPEASSPSSSPSDFSSSASSYSAPDVYPEDFDYNIDESVVNSSGAVYEIFVGSFADSNGDGIGDFNGIAAKLDYLKALGVSNLWLTPIMPSPSYHKYDVKDYCSVDPSFGTMADFDSLVAAAKAKNIGILLDMVLNHSSSQNPWFIQAKEDYATGYAGSDSCAKDYVFFDSYPSNPYGRTYSQTTCDGKSFYYECNFSSDMPEFDLSQDSVKAKFRAIMDFWLDQHGVGGFRFDGCAYYFYGDQASNIAFCRFLNDAVRVGTSIGGTVYPALNPSAYLVGEAWVDNMTQPTVASYGSSDLNFFDFPMSASASDAPLVNLALNAGGQNFAARVVSFQTAMAAKSALSEPCFFLANHDMDRVASRYAIRPIHTVEYEKLSASEYLLTPGTPFIYYGEEIAMTGTRAGNTDANRRLP